MKEVRLTLTVPELKAACEALAESESQDPATLSLWRKCHRAAKRLEASPPSDSPHPFEREEFQSP